MRRTAAALRPEIRSGGDSSVSVLDEMKGGGGRVSLGCGVEKMWHRKKGRWWQLGCFKGGGGRLRGEE
jgi:hypothetical protein